MQINKIRENVKVTVVCITYRHEEYIREALDSFLMQKTDFDYQIFVGEDHGPDRTAEIVREYAQKYPDKIVAFLREENMGAQHNLIDLCERAKSVYIAICEGDDYWIDESKLQKQYDFMESHPQVGVCGAHAKIQAPRDWFLRSYFREDEEGKLIYPECDPNCPKTNKEELTYFEIADCWNCMVLHTSTIFYRWDYEVKIPDWYYEGIIGDMSLLFLQLGSNQCVLLPDIVSVYRRSDVGVYMSDSMDEHFLKTRMDWIRIATGMLDFYEEHQISGYPRQKIIERRRLEANNFIQTAIRCHQVEKIQELLIKYPDFCEELFGLYLSYYTVNQKMIRILSWEGKQLFVSNSGFMHLLAPFVKFSARVWKRYHKAKSGIRSFLIHLFRFIAYWIFTMVPKKKELWVFSGFLKKNYMDNAKYLFEYVSRSHPEIEAVWVTKNQDIKQKLEQEGFGVYQMNSFKGIWKTARAAIAVTDHFIMSDYSPLYGYNNRTKVVQLWHGVGFKSMGDGEKVHNTDIPGVVYSTDILPCEDDTGKKRIWKKIKYIFLAPGRELFEKYFMLVCPGQERMDMIGRRWNMDESSFFMAGHPRNIQIYNKFGMVEKKNKVLYAPTYRFHAKKEKEMIVRCMDCVPQIQQFMEKIQGEFVIRLHPHTWRNYKNMIQTVIRQYDRVSLDETEDFYDEILSYSYVVTDYSSISLDCALFGIPCVYLCEDYEWFVQNEAGFGVDFMNMTPGPKAFCWEDVLQELDHYSKDAGYMRKEREKILSYYFTKDANSEKDSQRIVCELKKRLKFQEKGGAPDEYCHADCRR